MENPDFVKNNVTCIHSVTDLNGKKTRSFGEKDRAGCYVQDSSPKLAGPKDDSSGHPKIDGVAVTCRKGLKPEAPNQDSFAIVVCPGKWGLYGVFDGHGPNGHDVSDFAVRSLEDNFFKEDYLGNTGPAFTKAFTDCQATIAALPKAQVDASSSGSTCTMAFHNVETDTLTFAHIADSRGAIYTKAETPLNVIKETEDHKPNLPAEKARIEKKGGRVVFDGYYNYRVFAKAGMYPGLNMSRAFGDLVAHNEAGLTAEPELNIVQLKDLRKEKLTLIIASDGVWEFIETKKAPEWLTEKGNGEGASTAVDISKCDALAKASWDAWMADSENEISDDITAIVVTL